MSGLALPAGMLEWLVDLLCGYAILVESLRFRRAQGIARRMGYRTRDSWRDMTVEDAFQIQLALGHLEFPQVFGLAIFFALFKTYGIPSISRLLKHTGHLTDKATVSKRAADTGVILAEIVLNSPSSDRAIAAVARMNQLHAPYRKGNRISNDDMLYTLSLFALEPSRWVQLYEWRRLTDLELCAVGTYWKSLGDAMGITYEVLPGASSGWTDGLQWLEEIKTWSLAYEETYMMPARSNREVADETIKVLLWNVPHRFLPFATDVIKVLMGDRLRQSMLFEEPSAFARKFTVIILGIRRFVIRHLCLPRPYFQRVLHHTEKPDPKTGRYHQVGYLAHPWYVRPSLRSRWNFKGWLRWTIRSPLPGDGGETYIPQGYHLHEIGPRPLADKTALPTQDVETHFNQVVSGGCPFRGLSTLSS
ncbi:MAG: hypothetical protein M1828_003697 [Chrysothrix sp. TS-e1954]|nr:MAG: hypothetical protein M1828_003697 [Chrysothrix sp. TS-e1954]